MHGCRCGLLWSRLRGVLLLGGHRCGLGRNRSRRGALNALRGHRGLHGHGSRSLRELLRRGLRGLRELLRRSGVPRLHGRSVGGCGLGGCCERALGGTGERRGRIARNRTVFRREAGDVDSLARVVLRRALEGNVLREGARHVRTVALDVHHFGGALNLGHDVGAHVAAVHLVVVVRDRVAEVVVLAGELRPEVGVRLIDDHDVRHHRAVALHHLVLDAHDLLDRHAAPVGSALAVHLADDGVGAHAVLRDVGPHVLRAVALRLLDLRLAQGARVGLVVVDVVEAQDVAPVRDVMEAAAAHALLHRDNVGVREGALADGAHGVLPRLLLRAVPHVLRNLDVARASDRRVVGHHVVHHRGQEAQHRARTYVQLEIAVARRTLVLRVLRKALYQ